MKYLKKYKLFESIDIEEIRMEVKDLLAYLEDDGYEITVNSTKVMDEDILIITIQNIEESGNRIPRNQKKEFKWIDIRPELQNMVGYLKDRFLLRRTWLYVCTKNGGDKNFSFDWIIPTIGTDNLTVRKVELRFSSESE